MVSLSQLPSDPEQLDRVFEGQALGWASDPATEPEVLRWIWKYRPFWLTSGMSWPCANGLHATIKLNNKTKIAVLTNPSTPVDLLEKVAQGPFPCLRVLVASNPSFLQALRELLIRAGSTPDLHGLSGAPGVLTDEERVALIERGPFGRMLVFAHPATATEIREQLRDKVLREKALVDPEWEHQIL